VAGNPVISVPDSAKLEAALPLLECFIAVDNYLNETTRFAHVILPGPSPLESPHYDELLWSWASRSAGKWSDAVFPLPPGRPDEWEVLIRLGQLLSGKRNDEIDVAAVDDAFFSVLCAATGLDAEKVLAQYDHGGPERMTDWSIRVGPFGDRYGEKPEGLTLEKIKAEPNGVDRGPMIPRARDAVCTPDGHIALAPAYVLSDLPRLAERVRSAAARRELDGMVLVSRRHIRSKNTWLHNVSVLVKGKDRCTLLVNPGDAARIGLVDGGRARVTSEAGSIEAPVEISDEMMTGVVCLPHGWGHDAEGTRLSIAREHAGVNNNLLAPGDFVDVLSGNAAVNGIPVEVVPA
jgi:anaerobic selenocysteine-containing dehydrogenase